MAPRSNGCRADHSARVHSRSGPRASNVAAPGHADSAVEESFSTALEGNPEYPHYTRPAEYRGWTVPDVLLSGHHQEISTWRRLRSRERGGS